jgi:TolA-binding protein
MHEYDLEEIKREIVEGRSLTIKTNNLVNALSADLKSIAKRQQGYERRIFIHSITAYVVAVVIILGLTKVALDAQVDAVRAESKSTTERLAEAESQLAVLQKREEARARASRESAQLYQIIDSGDRRKILQALPQVASLELSPTERAVFEEAGRKARRELSIQSYQAGIEHLRAGRYHEATQSLRESLDLEFDSPHAGQATYELARAYRALDQQRAAIPLLMALTEASTSVDVLDEATLLLAECQADIELYNDAKATLRTFLRRFDASPLKNDAKILLSQLNMKH